MHLVNPADWCSRGLPADELPSEHVWSRGLSFSREVEAAWPVNIPFRESNDDDSEVVPKFIGAVWSPQTRLECEFVNFILHLDSEGILRVGGRLGNSSLPYGLKHPIILPRHSRLTCLLILNI